MAKRTPPAGAPKWKPVKGHNYLQDWHDAIDRERELRALAFLDVPIYLGSIQVRPIRLRDYDILLARNSPIIHRNPYGLEALRELLALIKPGHDRYNPAHTTALYQELAEQDFATLAKDLEGYLDFIFLDAPQGGADGQAVTHFVASVVNRVSKEYHWDLEKVLDLPLPRLYQLLREIKRNHDPKAIPPNRLSDTASRLYMKARRYYKGARRKRWIKEQAEGLRKGAE